MNNNYSRFGSVMNGRTFSSEKYRYGYQGSEKDNEVKGEGLSYTTEYRILDPRLGRWLSIDPKMNAWDNPYMSMGNNPIQFNDPLGDIVDKGQKGTKEYRQHRRDYFMASIGNKKLREKYKRLDEDKNVTYHLRKVEDKPSLADGGELHGVDANNVNWNYSQVQSEPNEPEPIAIEWEKKMLGGQKVVTKEFEKGYNSGNSGKDPAEIDQSIVLRRRVPGAPIELGAFDKPDNFTIYNRSKGANEGSYFLGGASFFGTRTTTLILANPSAGKLVVKIHSHNINTLMPGASTATGTTGTTKGYVSYTKFTGLHIPIYYPKLAK